MCVNLQLTTSNIQPSSIEEEFQPSKTFIQHLSF
jgi:hypothetical protein